MGGCWQWEIRSLWWQTSQGFIILLPLTIMQEHLIVIFSFNAFPDLPQTFLDNVSLLGFKDLDALECNTHPAKTVKDPILVHCVQSVVHLMVSTSSQGINSRLSLFSRWINSQRSHTGPLCWIRCSPGGVNFLPYWSSVLDPLFTWWCQLPLKGSTQGLVSSLDGLTVKDPLPSWMEGGVTKHTKKFLCIFAWFRACFDINFLSG